MARLNMMKGVIAAAGVLGGVALAALPAAFAQASTQTTPADHGGSMMQQGMPNDQGGMMPGMMGSGEMQQKMARMMDNCNRMMESMMQNKAGTPPASPNKG
jgi:Spy/CpxP family protein refolding chaperone